MLRLMRLLHLREKHTVALQAILMGLAGTAAALLFEEGTNAVQYLYSGVWGGRIDWFARASYLLRIIIPVVGAVVAASILLWADARYHSAAPEYMEAFSLGNGRLHRRQGFFRSLSAAVSLGTGVCIGKEGALMQSAAVAASGIGRLLHVSAPRLRLMVGCGAAAGMTAAFHTPLAACLFVCEIVIGTFSIGYLAPLLTASGAAYLTVWLLGRHAPLFPCAGAFGSVHEILLCALLAVPAAAAGRLWVWLLGTSRRLLSGRALWLIPRMTAAAAAVGAVACLQPYIIGHGQEAISALLQGQFNAGESAQLCLLKALLIALVFGVGTMGGVLTPTLMIGCALGTAFGMQAAAWQMIPQGHIVIFSMVGMAVFFAAAGRAPITAIILVIELSLCADLIFPTMAAVTIAYGLCRLLPGKSLYDASVAPLPGERHKLATVLVADIMHPHPFCVCEDVPLSRMEHLLLRHPGECIPVVTAQGQLCGIIPAGLSETETEGAITAGKLMRSELPGLTSETRLPEALSAFNTTTADSLPVVTPETGQLCGSVSRDELYRTVALLMRRELAEHR